MAKNLATKFSPKVAERYAHKSYAAGAASNEYNFDGAHTVKLYSVDTVPLANYNRNGTSRFGTPTDLTDFVQEINLTQDRGFTFIIDKGDNAEQLNIKGANKALQREIDERAIPEADKYAFKKWVNGAGDAVVYSVAITANNSLEGIQDATEILDEAACPVAGRTLFCSGAYLKLLKRNPSFVYTDKLANEAMVAGAIGELDGMTIVKVPSSWLPAGVKALVTQKAAVIAPFVIKDYKIHSDPPGINGNLVEGRLLYEAAVLDAKAKSVVAICGSDVTRCNAPAIAANGTITIGDGVTWYTVDGTDPRCSGTRASIAANGAATHTAGDTIRAAAYDATKTVAWSEEKSEKTTS